MHAVKKWQEPVLLHFILCARCDAICSIKFIKHIKGEYVRHLLPIGGEPAAREGAHSNSGA